MDDQVLLWQIFSQQDCTWAFSAGGKKKKRHIIEHGEGGM